jgi:hypothetical protein
VCVLQAISEWLCCYRKENVCLVFARMLERELVWPLREGKVGSLLYAGGLSGTCFMLASNN